MQRPDSCTRAMVLSDTPAILATSARVLIGWTFGEFSKRLRSVRRPWFSRAFAAMICFLFRASSPRAMVSWDTPAILAISARVSIAGFAEFCKGRGVAPPVEVTRFFFAFAAMICFLFRASSPRANGVRFRRENW